MSLREDMEKATKEVVDEVHVEDAQVEAFVERQFNNMIEHCENTGISVKAATVEALDGFENGLKAEDQKIKEMFRKAVSKKFNIKSGG